MAELNVVGCPSVRVTVLALANFFYLPPRDREGVSPHGMVYGTRKAARCVEHRTRRGRSVGTEPVPPGLAMKSQVWSVILMRSAMRVWRRRDGESRR